MKNIILCEALSYRTCTLPSQNQNSWYSLVQTEESWLPMFWHCHNEGKYTDKPKI
jgi:hypothetical protein